MAQLSRSASSHNQVNSVCCVRRCIDTLTTQVACVGKAVASIDLLKYLGIDCSNAVKVYVCVPSVWSACMPPVSAAGCTNRTACGNVCTAACQLLPSDSKPGVRLASCLLHYPSCLLVMSISPGDPCQVPCSSPPEDPVGLKVAATNVPICIWASAYLSHDRQRVVSQEPQIDIPADVMKQCALQVGWSVSRGSTLFAMDSEPLVSPVHYDERVLSICVTVGYDFTCIF